MKHSITTMQEASTSILAKIIQEKHNNNNSKRAQFIFSFTKELFKRKK